VDNIIIFLGMCTLILVVVMGAGNVAPNTEPLFNKEAYQLNRECYGMEKGYRLHSFNEHVIVCKKGDVYRNLERE